MSYEIVFKTVVVENNDKIYHFFRSGCNNDDAGRKDDEFDVKVYDNKEHALKDIERFKGAFEDYLKLNSKFVTYDYYYRYLKKKIEKPLSFEKFKKDYYYSFSLLESISCKNNGVNYTANEFNKIWRDLQKEYGRITISYNFKDLQLEELTSNMKSVRVYIKKRKQYK